MKPTMIFHRYLWYLSFVLLSATLSLFWLRQETKDLRNQNASLIQWLEKLTDEVRHLEDISLIGYLHWLPGLQRFLPQAPDFNVVFQKEEETGPSLASRIRAIGDYLRFTKELDSNIKVKNRIKALLNYNTIQNRYSILGLFGMYQMEEKDINFMEKRETGYPLLWELTLFLVFPGFLYLIYFRFINNSTSVSKEDYQEELVKYHYKTATESDINADEQVWKDHPKNQDAQISPHDDGKQYEAGASVEGEVKETIIVDVKERQFLASGAVIQEPPHHENIFTSEIAQKLEKDEDYRKTKLSQDYHIGKKRLEYSMEDLIRMSESPLCLVKPCINPQTSEIQIENCMENVSLRYGSLRDEGMFVDKTQISERRRVGQKSAGRTHWRQNLKDLDHQFRNRNSNTINSDLEQNQS